MTIFHTFYGFLKALTSWHAHSPKIHRYAIGETALRQSHGILFLFLRANASIGYHRLSHLREASIQVDILKIFLRLAKDTHAMTDKTYIELQGKLIETGKMLGGWIKNPSGDTKRPPTDTEGDRGK